MIRRPPRSTLSSSSAASDVYKRQNLDRSLRFTWAYNLQSGFNPKDLMGKEFGTGMNFKNINGILESLSEVISKGKPARLELRGNGPYGERIFDFYFEPKRNAQ